MLEITDLPEVFNEICTKLARLNPSNPVITGEFTDTDFADNPDYTLESVSIELDPVFESAGNFDRELIEDAIGELVALCARAIASLHYMNCYSATVKFSLDVLRASLKFDTLAVTYEFIENRNDDLASSQSVCDFPTNTHSVRRSLAYINTTLGESSPAVTHTVKKKIML